MKHICIRSHSSVLGFLGQSLTLCALILLLASATSSQTTTGSDRNTPVGLKPGAPAGSYPLSGFENLNIYNGNLNFRLPLLQMGGRGTAGHTVMLALNTKKWSVKFEQQSETVQRWTPTHSPWGNPYAGYGAGKLEGRKSGFGVKPGTGCPPLPQGTKIFKTTLTTLTFRAADGTEIDFRDVAHGGQRLTVPAGCPQFPYTGPSRGNVFVSSDGSGATFISGSEIFDRVDIPNFARTFTPSGILILRDGTRYHITGGLVDWIQDRNGNRVTFAGPGAADSLGRTATFEYDVNDPVYGLCDRIKYSGFGGVDRFIYITKINLLSGALRADQTPKTVFELFPELNGAAFSTGQYNPQVISAVVLPDGRSYQFRYNSYGEIARVVLPTGGAIEYDMTPGSGVVRGNNGQGDALEIYRRLQVRRTYANGADPSSLTNRTVYTVPSLSNSTVTEEQFDRNGVLQAVSKHLFIGVPIDGLIQQLDGEGFPIQTYPSPLEGREFATEFYNTDGVSATTLMQKVTSTWESGTTLGGFSINPRLREITTLLNDLNLVSKQSFLYDQCAGCNSSFNNQTDVYEYDYGPGAPGPFVRRSHTDYVTSATYVNADVDPNLGAHIRNLPSQHWVSSDTAGNNKLSFTTYEYDNYVNDTRHKPLVPRSNATGPNIIGHDAAYGVSFTVRGNLTGVTSYADASAQTGPVTASTQFDVAGTVVANVDGLVRTTSIGYEDSFCNGTTCGGTYTPYTFAFATTITSPVPDSTGQYGSATPLVRSSAYDFWTGKLTSSTDANGRTDTIRYDDPLDRPKQVIQAVGTGDVSQTTFDYNDNTHVITITSDLNTYNDNLLKSETVYDGLGRTTENRHYEGGTNYIAQLVEYDALGRVYRSSNPFRPGLETINWTTTAFDALGRVRTVTSPGSAVVTTAYSGNKVQVTDPDRKSRRSETDALGRLSEIVEFTRIISDPTVVDNALATDHVTSYKYDVLGNLRRVVQGTQERFFMYDSLSHLIRAKNPEQDDFATDGDFPALTDATSGKINSSWSTAYKYDNNGNLDKRKDARNITSTYAYDALNRNITVIYSGTAPSPYITRIYDFATNGRGRLRESYAGGNDTIGSNVEHVKIQDYDAMGRPKDQRQRFKTNSAWSNEEYKTLREYNLAGGVKLQTYPSGRKVNYSYDNAGRTLSFAGDIVDGVPRTYASGITYSSYGGTQQEQFGTQTPLFHKLHYNVRGQLNDLRLSTVSWQTDQWDWNRGALLNYYSQAELSCPDQACKANSGPTNNGNVVQTQHWVPANEQASNYNWTEDRYTHDDLNRLKSVAEFHGSSTTGYSGQDFKQIYQYDQWGNRTIDSATIGAPAPQFTASSVNNRLSVPAGQPGRMDYDPAGNLINDTYTPLSFGSTNGTATRLYDAENRLMTVKDGNLQEVSSYTYNADGQRTRRKVSTAETWHIYGMEGELVAEYAANGSKLQPQKEYGYRGGELLITSSTSSAPSSTENVIWTSASGVAVNGNSLQRTSGGFFGGAASSQALASGDGYVEFTASETNKNRWCGLSNGNSNVNSGDIDFAIYLVGGGTLQIIEFGAYKTSSDYAMGDRFRISVVAGVVKYSKNGVVFYTSATAPTYPLLVDTSFYESGGTITNTIISGNLGGGSGGGTPEIKWLVADHLGTPRIIVDKTGSLAGVKRHDYLPFGEELGLISGRTTDMGYSANSTNDTVRQKFTSKERDSETSLDYFGARYYASPQGRFTSPDPLLSSGAIYNPQTWNRYSYALNNPLRYTDPTGLYTFSAALGGSATDAQLRQRAITEGDKANAENIIAQRNQFRDALIGATTAAESCDLTTAQGQQVQRAVDAYGSENDGNNVVVGNAPRREGTGGSTSRGPGGTITVNFDPSVTGDELIGAVAHEGSHVADRQDFMASNKAGGPADLTKYETERRAYMVSSYVSQALGEEIFPANYAQMPSAQVWNKGWASADRETSRKAGVDKFLSSRVSYYVNGNPLTPQNPGKRYSEEK